MEAPCKYSQTAINTIIDFVLLKPFRRVYETIYLCILYNEYYTYRT
jgi:hypothetical protein